MFSHSDTIRIFRKANRCQQQLLVFPMFLISGPFEGPPGDFLIVEKTCSDLFDPCAKFLVRCQKFLEKTQSLSGKFMTEINRLFNNDESFVIIETWPERNFAKILKVSVKYWPIICFNVNSAQIFLIVLSFMSNLSLRLFKILFSWNFG